MTTLVVDLRKTKQAEGIPLRMLRGFTGQVSADPDYAFEEWELRGAGIGTGILVGIIAMKHASSVILGSGKAIGLLEAAGFYGGK